MLIRNVLGFTFVALLYADFAFGVSGCLKFPWWYQLGSDWDGVYITQTLALMNNGEITSFSHPGATLIAVQGFCYHVLALFFPAYQPFLHLAQLPGPTAVFDVLDLAMHTSRVIMVAVHLCGLVMLWRLLFQLTRSNGLAFTLSAFFMTASFMIKDRSFSLRPEIITLICLAGMLSIALGGWARSRASIAPILIRSAAIGLLGGLAFLAKTQALPEIVLLMAMWTVYLYPKEKIASVRTAGISLALAALNVLLMPWAWLRRPAMLTDAYLNHLYPSGEQRLTYGTAPATWEPNVAPLFIALLVLSLIALALHKRFPAFSQGMLRCNALVTGIILALRFVFVPLGMDHAAYTAASNHLIYAVLGSMVFGSNMNHAVVDAGTLRTVLAMHGETFILGIPVLGIVAAACASSLFRLCTLPAGRRPYAAVLLLTAVGLIMDMISTFRQYAPGVVMYTYAIYSLSPFVCGLGIWLAEESRRVRFPFTWITLTRIACLVLAVHLAGVAKDVLSRPWSEGRRQPNKTPAIEMETTLSQSPSFWKIASHGQI